MSGSATALPGPGAAGAAPVSRQPAGEGAAALRPGELVLGQLVEARGAGEGILELGGRLLHAFYPEGLTAGERLVLRVASLGPPLVLQLPDPVQEPLAQLLRPPGTGFASAVQTLLAQGAEGLGPAERELLAGIQRLLSVPTSPADMSQALQRFLTRSGVFHEAHLAGGRDPQDLKALVLRLLPRIEQGPLARALESVLGHVEAYQARSVLDGVPVIPLVLIWGGETVRGEWVVEERSTQGAEGTAASGSLRLRLDMPHLGHAEVAVRWGPLGTSARLRLQPAALEAATARSAELAEALVRAGAPRLVDLRLEPLTDLPARPGPGRIAVLA